MSASILKEYLVKLGFKIDEGQFRRFSEVMNATGKRFVEIGKTSLAATGVMGSSLQKIGSQLENLYYAAQRTGASAGELKEFAFAASQIGVSAEQAQAAIEGLAASRRTNPWVERHPGRSRHRSAADRQRQGDGAAAPEVALDVSCVKCGVVFRQRSWGQKYCGKGCSGYGRKDGKS